jgi:hypothetical protein
MQRNSSGPRTAVIRTNLTPAEHRAFSRACAAEGQQKAEVLREFARWFTQHHAEAMQAWLAALKGYPGKL